MSEPMADIEPATAYDRHESGAVVLLDVREPEEWRAGHAPGALHVPLGELDPNRISGEVVVVCRSGHRSGRAAVLLARSGVSVRNMAGGMQAWQSGGLPVVTPSGDPGIVA